MRNFGKGLAAAEIPLETASEVVPINFNKPQEPMSGLNLLGWLLLGCLLFGMIRLYFGWNEVRKLRKRSHIVLDHSANRLVQEFASQCGVTQKVQLLENSILTTPATVGWLRPAILLPIDWREWRESELSSSIAHELAHVTHNDFAKNLLAQIAIALNFFNPVVHWLVKELRVSQELLADQMAASVSGGSKNYLATMAEMALIHDSKQMGWLAQPFLPTRKTFVRRIEMLKGNRKLRGTKNPSLKWTWRALILVLAVMCIGFRQPEIGMAVLQVVDAPVASGVQDALGSDQPKKQDTVVEDSPAEPNPLAENRLAFVSDRTKFFVAVNLDQGRKIGGVSKLLDELYRAKTIPFDVRKARSVTGSNL